MVDCNDINGTVYNTSKIEFYLDSGASSHYINDCNLLDQSVDLDKLIKIKVFKKDVEVTVNKIGTTSCYYGDTNITMNNVMYLKIFPSNLISVKCLNKNGISDETVKLLDK